MRRQGFLRWLPLALAVAFAPTAVRAQKPAADGHAGSSTCAECHKEQVAQFNALREL